MIRAHLLVLVKLCFCAAARYPATMSAQVKHSLTLKGHRTSVTLEPEFWQAFTRIARLSESSVNALASEVDAKRRPGEGLASSIRIFCLQYYQQIASSGVANARSPHASVSKPAPD